MEFSIKKALCAVSFLCPLAPLSAWQIVSLDKENNGDVAVWKESGNCFLEHALLDYHHYYASAYRQKILDVAASPFFENLSVIEGDRHSENVGAFLLTQFNFNDLWARLYTSVSTLKEKIGKNAGAETETSVTGFDDVVIKLGSDNFANGCDHVGIYGLCAFPVKSLTLNMASPRYHYDDVDFILSPAEVPLLGVGNYRIGVGLNGGWSLAQTQTTHLAVLADFQYYYSIPRTLGSEFTPLTNEVGSAYQEAVKKTKGEVRLTPGHTIEGWTAFHYDYHNFNIECGAVFSTTFGFRCHDVDLKAIREQNAGSVDERRRNLRNTIAKYDQYIAQLESVPDAQKDPGKILQWSELKHREEERLDALPESKAPDKPAEKDLIIRGLETVKFGVQPYLALSYSGAISSMPFTLGLGAGYEYAKTRAKEKPSSLQGYVLWGTVEASF